MTVSCGRMPEWGSAFRPQDDLVRRSHHCHPDITNEPPEGQKARQQLAQSLSAIGGRVRTCPGLWHAWSRLFLLPLLTLRKQQGHSHPPKLSVGREGSWGDGLDPVELQAAAGTEHRGGLRSGHPSPGCCLLGSPTQTRPSPLLPCSHPLWNRWVGTGRQRGLL